MPPPPPMAVDDMEIKSEELLVEDLIKFLNLLLAGTTEVEDKCEKSWRL